MREVETLLCVVPECPPECDQTITLNPEGAAKGPFEFNRKISLKLEGLLGVRLTV